MKKSASFLADSLNETFGPSIMKKTASQQVVAASPVVEAMECMDRAAEIFETLGIVTVAKKIGKVMKKVTDRLE